MPEVIVMVRINCAVLPAISVASEVSHPDIISSISQDITLKSTLNIKN